MGSGGPRLRPGIFVPLHPRSMGLNFKNLNETLESRSLMSFASLFGKYRISIRFNMNLINNLNHLSGSSGSFCRCTNSLPWMTGTVRPGQTILALPTPMICPLFRSLDLFRAAPRPRPFLAPALLTDVTLFHMNSAGTKIVKMI